MDTEQIGIKLADGSFYPLLKVGTPACKTLELTTANDNQTAISLDLYRTKTGDMTDATLVETLHLENLPAHANGVLTISLCVELDENEVLSAELREIESDARCNKIVSLTSLTADVSSSNDLILDAPDTSQDIDLSSLVLPDPVPGESEDADWTNENPLILPDPAPDESSDSDSSANDTDTSIATDVTNDDTTNVDLTNLDSPADDAMDTENLVSLSENEESNTALSENEENVRIDSPMNDVDKDKTNDGSDSDLNDFDLPDDIDLTKPAESVQDNLEELVAPLDFENTSVDTTNTLGGEETGEASVKKNSQ